MEDSDVNDTTAFRQLVNEMKSKNPSMLAIPFAIGTLIVLLNSLQMWLLRNRFRRQVRKFDQ